MTLDIHIPHNRCVRCVGIRWSLSHTRLRRMKQFWKRLSYVCYPENSCLKPLYRPVVQRTKIVVLTVCCYHMWRSCIYAIFYRPKLKNKWFIGCLFRLAPFHRLFLFFSFSFYRYFVYREKIADCTNHHRHNVYSRKTMSTCWWNVFNYRMSINVIVRQNKCCCLNETCVARNTQWKEKK